MPKEVVPLVTFVGGALTSESFLSMSFLFPFPFYIKIFKYIYEHFIHTYGNIMYSYIVGMVAAVRKLSRDPDIRRHGHQQAHPK